ncbi:MAG: FAD-dependent oxidoreductase [Pseudomonadota bacterium]
MLDVAIVGGGLCGLALANSLQAQGLTFAVFEARPRLGGRIHTVEARNNGLPMDMGAAWFWPQTQPRITHLLRKLNLASFPQHDTGNLLNLPDPETPPVPLEMDDMHSGAQRIEGGAARLVEALAARLPGASLHLEQVLERLVLGEDRVELHFRHQPEPVPARQVVLALPPRLLEERIEFVPPLNGQLRETLRETPTWMGAHAKLAASYGKPDGMDAAGIDRAAFWRDDGQSGNGVATHPRAVLGEIHDACDALGARAGLSGFFALTAPLRAAFRLGLPMLARSQLIQWFGPRAQEAEIRIQDWADETWTSSRLDRIPAEEHPAYGNALLQMPCWNGRLHFGGSETASHGGGYMEGALESAGRLRRELLISRSALSGSVEACPS